ncbi:MAG: hypothetical protein NZ899_15245, partial [Thermoguttaceae bacterium]|nr:hypothetical protein [Thermoguttaceae bacterium]
LTLPREPGDTRAAKPRGYRDIASNLTTLGKSFRWLPHIKAYERASPSFTPTFFNSEAVRRSSGFITKKVKYRDNSSREEKR